MISLYNTSKVIIIKIILHSLILQKKKTRAKHKKA